MTTMMSRRLLLRFSAAIGALLAFHGSAAGELLFVRPLRKERPRVPIDQFTEGGKALVGVSGKGSVEARVREAVALIGGFRRMDIKGKTVLVKPNVVSGSPSPTTTSPELVATVVRILYQEGAREVVVGDMSALFT